MRRDWPFFARVLASILGRATPAGVSGNLLRDLDEGHRARLPQGARGANRWLTRQLVLALSPGRIRDLRRLPARSLRGVDDVSALRATGRLLMSLATDLRYSFRLLARSPAFSLTTVVILTGGLSVSLFTYSLLHTMMYKPLPLPAGDAVVRIFAVEDGRTGFIEGRTLDFVRRNVDSFEVMGTYDSRLVQIRGGVSPASISATFIEPNMFDITAVAPALGRRLLSADAEPGAEPVAILSHHIWNATFGADAEIVGSQVNLNGVSTRIVGVMPADFGFPVFGHIWIPVARSESAPPAGETTYVAAYAKLRPGVSAPRADVELHETIQRYRATVTDPDLLELTPDSAKTRTFQKAQMGDEAEVSFAIMNMAAGFILLLACVNAANLLLARCLERTREITIRVAIGASRLRLVTQMMGEGIIMTAVAGGLTIFITAQALALFDARTHAALPEGLAYWWRWGMDAPTLTVAGLLVLGTALLVGGIPAWRVVRADTNAALRDGQQGGQGLATDRLTRALVVLQIAAISVLLFLGGMAAYVTYQAGTIDFGLDTDRVLVGMVAMDEGDYPTRESRVAFLERVRREVEASATIEAVILRVQVGEEGPVMLEGAVYDTEANQPTARVRAQMGDSAMLGVELRVGRRLDERDGLGAAPTAVVSETLARDLWGTQSPLGRRLRVGSVEAPRGESTQPWLTVVGVVSDIYEGNPLDGDRKGKTLYLSMAQVAPTNAGITFRHRGDASAALVALTEALDEVGPTVELVRIINFDDMLDQMRGASLAASQVLGGCFGFALVLAIGGIYGLTSRSVTQRTQEIGIRRALGATKVRIIALFLRGSGRQLTIGLGLAAAVGVAASVAVLNLYPELDVGAFLAAGLLVPTLISGLVLTATYLPTRRAVRMNPRAAIWRE